jgi:hypothetical protein
MGKQELDNLVRIKRLKLEPGSRAEFDGMVRSARTHLADAQNESIDTDSQFDLAYGAAHRLALAALRQHGYRSEDRITVFQTLVHTVNSDRTDIQIFLKAHNERNLAEYEGSYGNQRATFGGPHPLHKEAGSRCSKAQSADRGIVQAMLLGSSWKSTTS